MMSYDYRNYLDCIKCDNQSLVATALIDILKLEGFIKIESFNDNLPVDKLYLNHGKFIKELSKKILVIVLFPGTSGWTIVKTQPYEFLCRRAINEQKPRLLRLAEITKCLTFHLGIYDGCLVLQEVDHYGNMVISGEHLFGSEEEQSFFYKEKINHRLEWKFHIIDIPANIAEAIKPTSEEEWKKNEDRLNELEILFEQGINTQAEEEKLLLGDGVKVDKVLKEFFGGSSPYWNMSKVFHKAYTQEEKIKADGGRVLFFETPEYYQQLNYIQEIATKY